MKRYIVDRIEEDFVVLQDEDKKMSDIPKSIIPDANEGDVVIFKDGVYVVDEEETISRKEKMVAKMKKLLKRGEL